MSDEMQIAQLRELYATYFDSRDAASFVTIFAHDATLVVPGGKEITGHERLGRLVEKMPATGGKHLTVPCDIKVDGNEARCCGPYQLERDGEVQTGQYDDSFVRTADGWRFARRVILPDA